ncbi:MAG: HNH endonuclease [Caldisericum sp.]|nr:HNH endonuclease [Caldisericum sp.]
MPAPKDPTKYQEWKNKVSKSKKGIPNPKISKILKEKGIKPPSRKGTRLTEEQKEELRAKMLGKKRPNISKALKEKGIKPPLHKGENNWRWKGGITPENLQIRHSLEMRLWRKAVFERDNFTCQKCGQKGGDLEAHHINNFADFPELRFAIDNGITLCKYCHKEFHKKYGFTNNTKEQLEEFLETISSS